MKRLTILAITLVFGIPIYASPMVWELSNVVFNEGGTATGFYTYDASTNTVSNWSINVFGGRSIVFPAYTYDLVTSYIPDPTLETDMNVFFFSKTVFCCGDSAAKRLIDISLNAPMTDAGGTIAMRTGINPTGSRECYNCAPARLAISGSITSVPEPSTIVLLMAALALLAFRVPRRGPAHVISLTVLMAAAFLHFGATPVRAQSDAMNGRLFVDRDRGRLGALCTNSDPCARITDALSMARAMRYGLDPAIPRLQPHKRINITVRASSTPYLGSPDPARLAANPNLEALPLFLNISDLDLAGESKFTRDTQGWIEENSVSDATIIKSEASLPGFLALILIGLSEGALADDVTVRGFVLDGNTQPSSAGILIGADRAQRFLIRDTYQINSTYGVVAQGSSGFVEQCFMSHLGEGVLVFGGNVTNWPSEVTVRNTRSIGTPLADWRSSAVRLSSMGRVRSPISERTRVSFSRYRSPEWSTGRSVMSSTTT